MSRDHMLSLIKKKKRYLVVYIQESSMPHKELCLINRMLDG